MEIIILGIMVILLVIIIIQNVLKNDTIKLKKENENLKDEIAKMLMLTREEISKNIGNKLVETSNIQQVGIANLTTINETKLENIRKSVEDKLILLQKDNSEKLEKMRVTVDEKLHNTLEQRLGQSFKLVNDRLESVYKGLGEMQTLAQGVGDLKKVFTNVKSRGFWGEIELGNILEQFLTKDQYLCSVKTKPKSNDFVEFAIKLPGKDSGEPVLLPVDSKFPIEDYTRLVDAEEQGNLELVNESRKKLYNSIKLFAKDIHDKYIETPYTTDFGIMFLPTESLYCEVVRNSDLCEVLSQKYRIVVAGPTTFVALLNSLQLGFKTLAIEKRSSEVWQLLGTIKSEFGKFGDLLDKTNKKLQEVSNTIGQATTKTRTIERKLKKVEALPVENESEFYEINLLNEYEEDTNINESEDLNDTEKISTENY